MLGNLPVIALAALSAVRASPLDRRQATTTTVAVASSGAPSTVASSAASVASSSSAAVVSSASSIASSAASAASSTVAAASSSPATTTAANVTTGNQTFPLYPCPTGYLLTYVTMNVTLPVPVAQAVAAFGNWSTSKIFPNVTSSNGTSAVGASHVLEVGGVALHEELVNVTLGGASGSVAYTWNLTGSPVTVMGVGVSNYSTVLSLYDPGFSTTNMTGTNTTALLYTNFCASSQTTGATLVSALEGLELGNLAGLIAGSASNTTSASSTAASSSMAASSSVASSHASTSAPVTTGSGTTAVAVDTSSGAAIGSSVASAASAAGTATHTTTA